MVSFRFFLCVLLGCVQAIRGPQHAPEPAPVVIQPSAQVRGPTERCRASYVFAGSAPPDARAADPFQQREGVLQGAAFGACVQMGPTELDEWIWVLMPFEPGFRGTVHCQVGDQRSLALEVVDADGSLPDWIRGRYAFMDAQQAAARIVPGASEPCPDLSPEDAAPPGPAFR
jgi:hypothetical protein